MSDPGYEYAEPFLPKLEADMLFIYLMDEQYIPWLKLESVPRWEYWMNDFERQYTYGRGNGIRTYSAFPWDREVRLVRDTLRMRTGVHYEGCFMNRYNTGEDALDWHADNDPGIDHTKPIAVVSLGERRTLNVRSNDKTWHDSYPLAHGSLLLMPPGSQHTHQHKITKGDRAGMGPRISLTFRALVP